MFCKDRHNFFNCALDVSDDLSAKFASLLTYGPWHLVRPGPSFPVGPGTSNDSGTQFENMDIFLVPGLLFDLVPLLLLGPDPCLQWHQSWIYCPYHIDGPCPAGFMGLNHYLYSPTHISGPCSTMFVGLGLLTIYWLQFYFSPVLLELPLGLPNGFIREKSQLILNLRSKIPIRLSLLTIYW